MKRENTLICILLVPSLFVLWVLAFQWTLIDWITPFLYPTLELAAWCVLGGATLISVILLVRKGRYKKTKFYLPLLACICTLLAAEFVPFTTIWLNFNFWLYRSDREKIAADIFSGKLQTNVSYNQSLIALPSGYSGLSTGGGEAVVEKFQNSPGVYFYTYRGILGSSSGYLFMSSDVTPSHDDKEGNDIVEIHKIAPRWFFVITQ